MSLEYNPMIRIFNVWHHRFFPELVAEVPENHKKDVVLYGVNEAVEKEYDATALRGFPIVFEYELPSHEPEWQRKNYCQTSCLYHVFRDQSLYAGYDYIGFMQYDMKIAGHTFSWLEDANARHPEEEIIYWVQAIHLFEAVIHHEPCLISHALSHYNRFFGTSFHADDLLHDKRCHCMPVVHSFVIPVPMFEKMMAWMSEYMRVLEANRPYPFRCSQADYMERVHGLFLCLECKRSNVRMCQVDGITHEWPFYHKQVKFENYHIRVDT